ncbi:MAG TPA: zinc dependent phospholipase C family protein [Thermodesulfovibrionales bacterium]|nr:zinc dependent phospholipase C family protein [Thermodesulfovibrionales bacterium]
MKIFKISVFLALFFIPSLAFAWGPLTHMYLGSEVFSIASLLPAGVYALIRKYRHDYLYGNLMADIIIGKKFLPEDKNPHSWEMALNLLESAETDQQRAFVLGYMSHLAADTVAHGKFMGKRRNLGHTLVEMRADSIIDRRYWFQAMSIDRKVQLRNDLFLEKSIDRAVFSFKTNKRIFRGMLLLSCFNQKRVGDFIQRNSYNPTILTKRNIQRLHEKSIDRIIDILANGENSEVLQKNPMVSRVR